MQRSEIQESKSWSNLPPYFAALHKGYENQGVRLLDYDWRVLQHGDRPFLRANQGLGHDELAAEGRIARPEWLESVAVTESGR